MDASTINIHLRDRNPGMVDAWREFFVGAEHVTISEGDIFGATADAIVSPANSFGYMDGGIDFVYSERFGWGLPDRLQALLREEHDGELPVGQAVIVETGDASIPYMVSAPTMRIPEEVPDSVNAYLAFRAVLRSVREFNRTSPGKISSVLSPGLCTAVGRMPYRKAAQQMWLAYSVVVEGRRDFHDRKFKALYNHSAMQRGEPLRSQ
jgi:O-acetyl-ADP-ribose deacetylase (regulator of RNase III)